jgi:transcriptional regulator with XRE-family HTH domain
MMGMAIHNGASPSTHFGRQMKKERLAHGWTLREFSARTGIDFSQASRIENGKQPPSEKVALACDEAWPERDGWFTEYYEESKSWTPAGFRNWAEYEDKAATLRAWSPGVLHGLLQTTHYARAQLETLSGATADVVAARLASRMQRQQRVLFRDDPPTAWFVVDDLSLYRMAGSPEVMTAQMQHLAEVATLPNVTMQLLPAVVHPVSSSELIVTDNEAYVEHLTGGLVYTDPETVTTLLRLFTKINAESNKASETLAAIERLGELWTGGSPLIQTLKADRASR